MKQPSKVNLDKESLIRTNTGWEKFDKAVLKKIEKSTSSDTVKEILFKEQDMKNKMKNPTLVKLIIDEIKKEGVIGEEDTIMVLILKISLRLVKNVTATSSNLLVSDISGTGKDHLTKRVCDVMLESEKTYFHRTDLSEKVLNYWEIKDKEKNPLSWNGKVIYLEDPNEAVIKSQGFKVRASGNNAITVLKDQVPTTILINGKPVFIVTSMKTSIDIEGTRRWDAVRIDAGKKLTQKIIEFSFLKAAGLIEYKPDVALRNGLKTLKIVEVAIPFAPKLANTLVKSTAMRTQVLKLIDYIKASAALHQYQREKNKKGEIVAIYEDYEYARFLFTHLQNMRGEALNKQEEDFINYLEEKKEPVKIKTILEEMSCVTKYWIYNNTDSLVERGLLNISFSFDADSNREVQHLSSTASYSIKEAQLPSAKKLFKTNTYAASGQIYKDINKDRKKLKILFKNLGE